MSLDKFFDFLGVRLNGPNAEGNEITLNFTLTDTGEKYALVVENATLHYSPNKLNPDAATTVMLTRSTINEIILGNASLDSQIKVGNVKFQGDTKKLAEFVGLLDSFELWFNIVTP